LATVNKAADPPPWAVDLRRAREGREWGRLELAHEMSQATDAALPASSSLVRMIRGWERGDNRPSERYTYLLRRVLGPHVLPSEPVEPQPAEVGNDLGDLLDLSRRAEISDVGAGVLDDLQVAVELMCRGYPTIPPLQLRNQTKDHLRFVLRLLDGRTSLRQHRELLVQAGWLSALLGCVYYDLNDRIAAEYARRMANRFAESADHGELRGWSSEMAAWFALVEGRYSDVIMHCEQGLLYAGGTNAAAQLHFQAARGYARMRDSAGVGESLRAGNLVLDQLPRPSNVDNHFVFDRDKLHFYATFIYTWLGSENEAAAEHAAEVIHQCEPRPGTTRWPTRLGITRLLMGMLAGRRNELEEALFYGRSGLELGRDPAGLLDRAAELHGELRTRYPRELSVREYGELVGSRRAALPTADPHPLPS
jgi:hypothetical protein